MLAFCRSARAARFLCVVVSACVCVLGMVTVCEAGIRIHKAHAGRIGGCLLT